MIHARYECILMIFLLTHRFQTLGRFVWDHTQLSTYRIQCKALIYLSALCWSLGSVFGSIKLRIYDIILHYLILNRSNHCLPCGKVPPKKYDEFIYTRNFIKNRSMDDIGSTLVFASIQNTETIHQTNTLLHFNRNAEACVCECIVASQSLTFFNEIRMRMLRWSMRKWVRSQCEC